MGRYGLLGLGLLIGGTPGVMAQRAPISRPTLKLPLPAPTGVTLAGRAPVITISWQPVAGAMEYSVLRSTDPAQPGAPVSPAGFVATSFVDQTAAAGTVYYYTVTAQLPSGVGSAPPVRFDPPQTIAKPGGMTRAGNVVPPPPAPPVVPPIQSVIGVTGVPDSVIPPGGLPVRILGPGIYDVTGVYFGTGPRGSFTNPRFVPVYSTTGEVQIRAPFGCTTRGPIELEHYGPPMTTDPNAISWTTQNPAAPQVRLYCASKPTIQNVLSAHPGSRLILNGANLSWVTQVTQVSNVPVPASPAFGVVNDNQLWVDIPPPTTQQSQLGQMIFQATLISRFGTTATQTMQFNLPPVVLEAKGMYVGADIPMPVEPGGTLLIWGYGLTSQTSGIASVTVDNIPASAATPGPQGSIRVTVPAGVTHGTFVVSTIGGPATGTFPLMTGPSTLTGVSPSDATVGSRVRVTGQNLTRIRGMCFNNAVRGQPDVLSTIFPLPPPSTPQMVVIQLWNDTDVMVTVPAGAASGRIGLYLPTTPAATAYACVPSAVRMQIR